MQNKHSFHVKINHFDISIYERWKGKGQNLKLYSESAKKFKISPLRRHFAIPENDFRVEN